MQEAPGRSTSVGTGRHLGARRRQKRTHCYPILYDKPLLQRITFHERIPFREAINVPVVSEPSPNSNGAVEASTTSSTRIPGKGYVTAGIYNKSGTARKVFPLPRGVSYNEMKRPRPFKLPYFLYREFFYDMDSDKDQSPEAQTAAAEPAQPPAISPWKVMRKNAYVKLNPPSKVPDLPRCVCEPGFCGEECLNRASFIECDPTCCPSGLADCTNRSIQELTARLAVHPENIGIKIVYSGSKGYGLYATRDFAPHELILEYTGDIIDTSEMERRLQHEYRGTDRFYCLSLGQGLAIDSGRRGSEARFVNHSCNPNSEMQKWFVRGAPRVGLFAGDKGVTAGTEFTYDYNFDVFNGAIAQKCCCGEPTCRGTIGKRPPKSSSNGSAVSESVPELTAPVASADAPVNPPVRVRIVLNKPKEVPGEPIVTTMVSKPQAPTPLVPVLGSPDSDSKPKKQRGHWSRRSSKLPAESDTPLPAAVAAAAAPRTLRNRVAKQRRRSSRAHHEPQSYALDSDSGAESDIDEEPSRALAISATEVDREQTPSPALSRRPRRRKSVRMRTSFRASESDGDAGDEVDAVEQTGRRRSRNNGSAGDFKLLASSDPQTPARATAPEDSDATGPSVEVPLLVPSPMGMVWQMFRVTPINKPVNGGDGTLQGMTMAPSCFGSPAVMGIAAGSSQGDLSRSAQQAVPPTPTPGQDKRSQQLDSPANTSHRTASPKIASVPARPLLLREPPAPRRDSSLPARPEQSGSPVSVTSVKSTNSLGSMQCSPDLAPAALPQPVQPVQPGQTGQLVQPAQQNEKAPPRPLNPPLRFSRHPQPQYAPSTSTDGVHLSTSSPDKSPDVQSVQPKRKRNRELAAPALSGVVSYISDDKPVIKPDRVLPRRNGSARSRTPVKTPVLVASSCTPVHTPDVNGQYQPPMNQFYVQPAHSPCIPAKCPRGLCRNPTTAAECQLLRHQ